MTERRFIEESFPIRQIGMEATREKNIRKKNIATLHIWWARRPLTASRTANYSSLINFPRNHEKRESITDFLIDFAKWENSFNIDKINLARKTIIENTDTPPKILDPFGGGVPFRLRHCAWDAKLMPVTTTQFQ